MEYTNLTKVMLNTVALLGTKFLCPLGDIYFGSGHDVTDACALGSE